MPLPSPVRIALTLAATLLVPEGPVLAQSASTVSPSLEATSAPALQILTAVYGSRHSSQTCSALAEVKRQCQGHLRCNIGVSETVCPSGERITSVLIPSLTVTYRCSVNDGTPLTAVADKPLHLTMSCMSRLR